MKKIFSVFVVAVLLAGVFGGVGFSGDYYFVKRVVDGDTVVLSNGDKVRLIGIDTPEVYATGKLYKDAERSGRDIKTIQRLGKRASEFTKKMLLGKRVRLEYDRANAHLGNRDRYGRLLAYIYLADGTFFNAEIIKQGYANAYTKFPFKHMDKFRILEREARKQGRGLWADEIKGSPALCEDGPKGRRKAHEKTALSDKGDVKEVMYIGSKNSKVFHKPSCKWAKMISEKNKVEFSSREEAVDEGYRPCQVCWP